MSKQATIPTKPPNDVPGTSPFVPRAMVIEFTHPEHGKVWISAEENDMNDNVMVWDSLSNGMNAYPGKAGIAHIKKVIKNVRKEHKDAVVRTNYQGWEPCE